MAQSFGSKRIVVGAHYGLRDWLSQRVTALLMTLFTLVVVVQVLLPGEMGYYKWSAIFASQWMKALTFVVIVSLLHHVWVGMRDVWMDYVKPVGHPPGAADLHDRVAGRVCGLGDPGAVEAVMQVGTSVSKRRFDVVIVGAGGSGHARLAAAGARRPERGGAVQGVSDPLAHGGGAGRHRRLARQHERGQLALPLLRHRQGQRLARRPGRDRVHVPRGAEGRLRARALRHAVRPQPRRHDLPASVRRPHRQLRREAGAARLRRGRPHRPRDAAHAVPAERQRRAPTSSSSGWRST